ncbi:MAG: sulfite exporter TauE/SafE family protein, partial [Candidatus Hydrogenedentes bacterium]|nr:sulfite exporter TauE/SafE family protein [Candidatus Hydrogenedentota bacterium]
MTYELLVIAFALFLGGAVQSIGGFGAMLVAVPLVTLVLPLQTTVPLLAMLGVPITAVVFYNNRHGIDWLEVARITSGALIGIPLGLWALRNVDSSFIMRGLGGLLIAYSVYALFIEPRLLANPHKTRASSHTLGFIVGLASGTLGGAFNTGGPPLIIYGDWLRWPKERFKAIIQGVFITNGSLVIAGHIVAGNIKVRIPAIAATQSEGKRPVIPMEGGHPFQSIAASCRSVATRVFN